MEIIIYIYYVMEIFIHIHYYVIEVIQTHYAMEISLHYSVEVIIHICEKCLDLSHLIISIYKITFTVYF